LYTAQEVRELESLLATKTRALNSNTKMLRERGGALPDNGSKLKAYISGIQVRI
jgi:hypothetical protein